jgi:uncharacterized protein (DUF2384 family)
MAPSRTSPPPRQDRATRRRLSGPGLRTFLAITEGWGLDEEDRRRVLGMPSRATYARWMRRARADEDLVLPTGILMRLAAVLTVHRLLRQLLGIGPEALTWLRAPHGAPPFGGQPPLALVTGGTLEGIDTVCRYLGALAHGHSAAPSPSGSMRQRAGPGKEA